MAIIRLQGAREKASGIYYEVDTSQPPIGEGGMGKVYRGKSVDTKTGVTRPVAIKFLFSNLPESAIERSRREAGIHLRNDNLIEMLGFIETEEERDGKLVKHYHVVSELLHGVPLSDIFEGKCTDANGNEIAYARKLLNEFSKTPVSFAKTVVKSVLSGLMALHDAGYIHRDIDPSNIMITEAGHIKLIDFGICKQLKNLTTNDKSLTVAGYFMGKPEYASPELALGDLKHHNQTTDTYAVGILLYQCIVGKVPFEGSKLDILDMQIKRKIPVGNITDKNLRRIVAKACEKRQENRYQTSAEMRVDIESLDVKRAADKSKSRLYIIGAAVLAVVVIGGICGFVAYRNHAEAKRQAMIERAYVDSLRNVVMRNRATGDSLAQIGFKHGEGYDQFLIDAKQRYRQAQEAASALKSRDVDLRYNTSTETKLDKALRAAHEELSQKAAVLMQDPDPVVAEEAKAVQARAEAVKKAL